MSFDYPVTPSFYNTGDWTADAHAHPCLATLHKVVLAVESGDTSHIAADLSQYFTSDFTCISADGQTATGRDAAWAQLSARNFSVIKNMYHQSESFIVFPNGNDEYEMFGNVVSCINLKDELAAAKGKAPGYVDKKGGKWDFGMPIAFKVLFKEDNGKWKISLHQTFMDASLLKELLSGS